jgi:CheY-like chemotaxis protein
MIGASAASRCVLVIEPDPVTAADLQNWLRSDFLEVEVVSSGCEALASMMRRPVDLVMTSTLLAPSEMAQVTAHIRTLPGRQPQIIDVPYFIDSVDATETRNGLSFLRGRRRGLRPRCSVGTFRRQLAEYLREAAVDRAPLVDRLETTLMPVQLVPTRAHQSNLVRPFAALPSNSMSRDDRRAAPRKRLSELPWLSTLRMPHVSHVEIVDVSRTGMLIETPTRLSSGSSLDIELLGPDLAMRVPARMLRTQVASVDSFGVRYRIAAAFARYVDMPGLAPSGARQVGVSTISELLQRLRDALDRTSGDEVMTTFETELKQLLPVRDIQLRGTPMATASGLESVYFTVPTGGSRPPVLQAIFEDGHQPTEMEFRVLKAAAGLAGAVLPFAPGVDLDALVA